MEELQEYLKKYPHLVPMQLEINKALLELDSQEARCYYLSELMLDKTYELVDEIKELNRRVNESR